jgi:hypothetical protein
MTAKTTIQFDHVERLPDDPSSSSTTTPPRQKARELYWLSLRNAMRNQQRRQAEADEAEGYRELADEHQKINAELGPQSFKTFPRE